MNTMRIEMAQARTDSTAPLTRRPASAKRDLPAKPTVPYDAEKMMAAGATVNAALGEIRGRVERVTGLLVATRDGLVLCSATHGITMGLFNTAAKQALSLLRQASSTSGWTPSVAPQAVGAQRRGAPGQTHRLW